MRQLLSILVIFTKVFFSVSGRYLVFYLINSNTNVIHISSTLSPQHYSFAEALTPNSSQPTNVSLTNRARTKILRCGDAQSSTSALPRLKPQRVRRWRKGPPSYGKRERRVSKGAAPTRIRHFRAARGVALSENARRQWRTYGRLRNCVARVHIRGFHCARAFVRRRLEKRV